MQVKVVHLIEDETTTIVFSADKTDEEIIKTVCDTFLNGLADGLLEEAPKTVEEFNAIGTFEMSIELHEVR